ncbi:DUF4145 domain-containing protein [Streptomyces sp. NPDC052644]
MVTDTLKFEESNTSSSRHSHEDMMNGGFHAVLNCGNRSCDLVRVVGDWGLSSGFGEDGAAYDDYLIPKFFAPALPLIESHDLCPGPVQDRIDMAAKIIFVDPSSAANRLRAATEALMDDQGIPRKHLQGGSIADLALHRRIGKFKVAKPQYADAADLLLAVKWIGNVGSHDDVLRIADVLEGVTFLDHALELIYDTSAEEIKRRAADVVSRKGVPADRFRRLPF